MVSAIERVVGSERGLAADADRIQVQEPSRPHSGKTYGCSGKRDQIRHIAAVQRQFDDALVFDYRTNRGSPGFDQRGVRLDLNLFGDLSNLESWINHRTAVHLQND